MRTALDRRSRTTAVSGPALRSRWYPPGWRTRLVAGTRPHLQLRPIDDPNDDPPESAVATGVLGYVTQRVYNLLRQFVRDGPVKMSWSSPVPLAMNDCPPVTSANDFITNCDCTKYLFLACARRLTSRGEKSEK